MTLPRLQDFPSLQTVSPFFYNILGGPLISSMLNQLGIALPGLGGATIRGSFSSSGSVGRVSFGSAAIQAGPVALDRMDITFNGTASNAGTSPLAAKWRMSTFTSGQELRKTESATFTIPIGGSVPLATSPLAA